MMKNSYIAHHGVKGQRHGIRRFIEEVLDEMARS